MKNSCPTMEVIDRKTFLQLEKLEKLQLLQGQWSITMGNGNDLCFFLFTR